ncbi:MAG: proton-conducting membrane transporter [Clostridia bacterium]|nr:proton-conducting membrane transporter [Clostridia bacterium]
MQSFWLPLAVLLPFGFGVLLYALPVRSYRLRLGLTLLFTTAVSALIVALLVDPPAAVEWIRFAPNLVFYQSIDGVGRFFLGILAALWPLTVLYAVSYMRHEAHTRMFFAFFTAAYGACIGIATAGNLFTMYCFYELLTLTTLPLVMQPMTHAARKASRMYFLYSIGGAAFAFAAMLFLIANGASGPFEAGGILKGNVPISADVARLFWLFGFVGFGVKAAIFPLHAWLPKASVAPTPVTALLHAVAVVKSGAFAVIRLTYDCYGTELLSGSWAQTAALLLVSFTIVYGSSIAVRETHFKRRLAYSTVANLSYILFGVTLMTPEGLSAALMHMAAHACIKIVLFFAAGAVLHQSGRESVYELDGIGRRMPATFVCFTISALSLMGVPPLNGFVSKWTLLRAGAELGGVAWIGCGALLVSALLTAIYLLSAARRAWFPDRNADIASLSTVREADGWMLAPMLMLTVATVLCGVFAEPIFAAAQAAAGL